MMLMRHAGRVFVSSMEMGTNQSLVTSSPTGEFVDAGVNAVVAAFYKEMGVTVEHAVVKLPPVEVVWKAMQGAQSRAQLVDRLRKREELIRLMKLDPLRYGYELDQWKRADELLEKSNELLVMGSNRSSKSEYAARTCVEVLVEKPEAIGWFFHTTEDTSKDMQQPLIYKYLPVEWRTARKNRVTNINYTVKNGFADKKFVLPNGSIGIFKYYKQDRDVIEGGQVDVWWCDELVPLDWIVTLRSRYVDRNGFGLITFTPVRGFTPTVGEYVTGAETVEWVKSDVLTDTVNYKGGKVGMVPFVQRCLNPKAAIIYFQAMFNPFTNYAKLKETVEGKSSVHKLERLHGVATRMQGNIFPKFGVHNIIPASKVPPPGPGVTNYQIIDFAWARNWAMIWVRCTEYKGKKRIYVYRDWPDQQTYGEWVLPSEKADGERGPAQNTLGWGVKQYKRMILEVEGGRGILNRREQRGTEGEGNSRGPSYAKDATEGRGGERDGGVIADELRKNGNYTTINTLVKLGNYLGGDAAPPYRLNGGTERIFMRYGDPRSGKASAVSDDGGTCLIDMMLEEQGDASGVVPSMDVQPAAGDNITEGVNLINEWLEYDEERPLSVENEPEFYVSEEAKQVIDCLRIWTGRDGLKGASKDFIDLLRYGAQMGIGYVDEGTLGGSGGGSY